jgi:hypothetical protein
MIPGYSAYQDIQRTVSISVSRGRTTRKSTPLFRACFHGSADMSTPPSGAITLWIVLGVRRSVSRPLVHCVRSSHDCTATADVRAPCVSQPLSNEQMRNLSQMICRTILRYRRGRVDAERIAHSVRQRSFSRSHYKQQLNFMLGVFFGAQVAAGVHRVPHRRSPR